MKKYRVIYQENSKIKKELIYESELKEYINTKNIIKIEELKRFLEIDITLFQNKNTYKRLIEEISTILDSNLSFDDAINILIKNSKNSFDLKILRAIEKALKSGSKISESLKVFEKDIGKIGILFFKIAEESSDIKSVFKIYFEYLKDMDEVKTKVFKAFRYPLFLVISVIIAFILIFNLVLPQFESLFLNMKIVLPLSTKLLILAKSYYYEIFFGLFVTIFCSFFIVKILIKKESKYRVVIEEFILKKIPIVSKFIRFYHLYVLFLELRIFLQSRYKFQIAILHIISLQNNKYILDTITSINSKMRNGISVYQAFLEAELFDDITLRQIYVGEVSNSLELSILKIEEYHAKQLKKRVDTFISLIEPIFFIFITLFILWIILALFVPMWNMSSFLNV